MEKYNKNSDPNILYNDIKGKGTGWCTAGGIETATEHIKGGDFYVYYTLDEKGEYTAPRIAIRMENNQIAEIRGVASNQNIESDMEQAVKEKLEEFPDKDKYLKKVHDMELLTKIYKKHQNKEELTKEELRFLYEIDSEIIGFGYDEDPIIKEIIETRNPKKDLAKVFDCKEENISLTNEEALKGNIICHYGDLDLNSTNVKGLVIPKYIKGNLYLFRLKIAEGLDLSNTYIGGSIYLPSLTSIEGLDLSNTYIRGNLNLRSLTNVKGSILPKRIEGDLSLSSLESAEGLDLSNTYIGGSIYLPSLTSAKGLDLSNTYIGIIIWLANLTSVEGLELPEDFDIENKLCAQKHVKEELLNRRNKTR